MSVRVYLRKQIHKFLHDYRRKRAINRSHSDMLSYIKNVNIPELTIEEINAVEQFWNRVANKLSSYSLNYYKIYKKINKFDVTYVPDDIYQPYFLPLLNPVHESYAFSNKGLYGLYFNDVLRPKELVRNIRGCFFDSRNNICSETEAIDIILSCKDKILIKPSIDTSCGRNVQLLNNSSYDIIKDSFNQYSENFVCQELVCQSNQTAMFNPSSLNTFRITTLFLNGKFSILSSVFRCGSPGAIVDNAGAGGIMVGVSLDGSFREYGYNRKGEVCKSSYNGFVFSGTKIQAFPEIIDLCKRLHTKLPFCAMVGWDIALNKDNRPMLLEVNLKCPEIFIQQMCNGPIFGDRLEEVIRYVSFRIN